MLYLAVFAESGIPGVVRMLIVLVVTAAVAFLVKKLVSIGFKNHRARTIIRMIGSILFFLIWFAGIVLALIQIGVDTTSILVGAGIVGIVLGLGSESIIADVLAGIFLIMDNDIQVGDIVALDDFRGEVTQIGIRTVSIKDPGGSVNIIRNSSIESIINLSREKSVAVVSVPVNYEDPLTKVEGAVAEALSAAASEYPSVFAEPPVYRGVDEMDDCNTYILITANVAEGNIYDARRIILRALKLAFEKHELKAPYAE
ncbi:MAG: mechanosensitive ion channel [Lachnospiraceae bacterium]|nr:mechanosensitive ion channel [Lachnospiraceae bacterium]